MSDIGPNWRDLVRAIEIKTTNSNGAANSAFPDYDDILERVQKSLLEASGLKMLPAEELATGTVYQRVIYERSAMRIEHLLASSVLSSPPSKKEGERFCDKCGTIRRTTDVCPLTGRDDCPPSD
jgi:hypothetical protein